MNPTSMPAIAGGTALANRENQINREFSVLTKEVEENASLSRNLCERLASITRNEPDAPPTDSKAQPEEYLVPLAEGIRTIRKQISQSNSLLRGILQRAEI